MLAVILIGAMFLGAVAVLPKFGYVNLLAVDQQQLRNIALSALDTVLLDAGYPTNWGQGVNFSAASVTRFGLASPSDTSMYVLDSDKVTRLVEKDEWGRPNPLGYLPADKARSILGLKGYGFNLTIQAPFKVVARDLAPPANPSDPTEQELRTIRYEITVTLNDGRPVPNAKIKAFIVYSEKVGSGTDEQYTTGIIGELQSTDALGRCKIAKSLSGQISDVVMLVKITVGNVNTVTSVYRRGGPRNEIAIVNVVGDNIVLTTPPATPRDNRWILSAHVLTEEDLMQLYQGTSTDVINWGSTTQWIKNFPGLTYMDPLMLIFNFKAVEKNNGRQGVLVIGSYPSYLGSRLLSYCTGRPDSETVTLQRNVIISGMTYTVEFTLWKEQ